MRTQGSKNVHTFTRCSTRDAMRCAFDDIKKECVNSLNTLLQFERELRTINTTQDGKCIVYNK